MSKATIADAHRILTGAPSMVIAPTKPGDPDHIQAHLRMILRCLPMPPGRHPTVLLASCDGVAATIVQLLLGGATQTDGFERVYNPDGHNRPRAIGAGVVTTDGDDAFIRYVWPPQLIGIQPIDGLRRVRLTDWLTMIRRPGSIELRTIDSVWAAEIAYTDLRF